MNKKQYQNPSTNAEYFGAMSSIMSPSDFFGQGQTTNPNGTDPKNIGRRF